MKKKISVKSKRRLMTFGVVSIFAIGYFCFTLIGYLYNYSSLKKEENNLNKELLTLQEKKLSLKSEIQKLNDPNYAVRYAKEKFLYSKDGEFVIKINDNNKTFNEIEEDNNLAYGMVILLVILVLSFIFIRLNRIKFRTKKNITSV